MPCFHPLSAWQSYPGDILKFSDAPKGSYSFEVGCFQCIGCRLDRSRDWATRIALEVATSTSAYFVTLTYNDEGLPIVRATLDNPLVDLKTGELFTGNTTWYPDVQKFIKDLRRYQKHHYDIDNIRFYCVCEYGSKGLRPHYHLAIFNAFLPDDDLTFHSRNALSQPIYESQFFSKIWRHGFSSVGELNWSSAAYMARYITKKQLGKDAVHAYNALNIKPEASYMSRMPGIGFDFYNANKAHIYASDEVIVNSFNGSRALPPPAYYDKLYTEDNPIDMFLIKQHRLYTANFAEDLKLTYTSLFPREQLIVDERLLEKRVTSLIRNIEI